MGLLDSLVSEMSGSLGGDASAHQDLLQGVIGMFSNSGGLVGLLGMLEKGGLGHLVSSWISTGQNLPISAEQITQALGSDKISQLAAKVGLSPQAASSSLAQLLPALVDRATPNGQLPQGGGGLLEGLAGLVGKLG